MCIVDWSSGVCSSDLNTRGAFTLGQNFVDASGAGRPSFLHSYGAHGTAIDGGDFFPHWVRARHHGLGAGLDDFSLTASAALGGRLFFPDTDSEIQDATAGVWGKRVQ